MNDKQLEIDMGVCGFPFCTIAEAHESGPGYPIMKDESLTITNRLMKMGYKAFYASTFVTLAKTADDAYYINIRIGVLTDTLFFIKA